MLDQVTLGTIQLLAILQIILEITLRLTFYVVVARRLWIYILQKKYIKALIVTILTAILSWKIAVLVLAHALYRVNKINEASYKQYTHAPSPGSTADYDRWKAEREQTNK